VLNHQRKAVYDRRRNVLMGSSNEIGVILDGIAEGDTQTLKIIAEKRAQLGEDEFIKTVRRMLLQTIDMLWVEHLEMMDYMRSSVNLRAYGQRDPLVEYKKEGLQMFRDMEASYKHQVKSVLPNIGVGAFKQEEEEMKEIHEKAKLITSGSESKGGTQRTSTEKSSKIGRNDMVTITNGEETKEMKYKKAQPLIEGGEWKII